MTDPTPLRGDLEQVARDFAQARNALTALTAAVTAGVESAGWPLAPWADPTSSGGDVYGWPRHCWGAHRSHPADRYWTSRFDWVLWGFDEPGDARRLRFGAGMVWSHWRGEPNPLHEPSWLDEMLALEPDDGWGPFDPPDDYDGRRLYRSISFGRLAQEPSLDAQAGLLVGLITSTFRLLDQHPPPHLGPPEIGDEGGH